MNNSQNGAVEILGEEMARITLSIVIVNWNTRDLLRTCLASLEPEAMSSWDVWVVDNGSTDGSQQMLQTIFPGVHLIANVDNRGYAAANNQGIEASSGRYVLLLNSDTLVPTGAIARLLAFVDSRPGIGAASPRLLQVDGTPQPYAFGHDPTLGYLLRRGFSRAVLRRALHDWTTDVPQRVDWVSGACMLVRREVIDQVGLLDERFFMYFEDNDWCLRMRQHGWTVWYVPEVEITHLGGQSLGQNSAAQRIYHRSLERFYSKHYSIAASLILRLLLAVYRSSVSI